MTKKTRKKIFGSLIILFLIGNIVAYNHAYQFTHFVDSDLEKTKRPEQLSFSEKIKTIFTGISIPKPKNNTFPTNHFETISLNSHEQLEAWQVDIPHSKGIVLMFHGYSSSKSGLLPYSDEFNKKGYSTFLIDFMGSGGSSGYTTTVGYKESRDVKAAFEYVKKENPNTEIILFGSSMGAVSIMKAIKDYKINPDKIIIECPFGSMLKTTKMRFKVMNIPSFPFAEMLLFYGGLQTGFNAFKHNPTEYAKEISIPTLLLYGAKDKRVTKGEINEIYENIKGEKTLKTFEKSGHEIYLNEHHADWNEIVNLFLKNEIHSKLNH